MRPNPATRPLMLLAAVSLAVAAAAALPRARALDDGPATLDAAVRARLEAHGEGVVASLWVGGTEGPAWYALEPDAARPTASAIKTAYLVALFARFANALDEPPPGLADALDDGHPAMEPYTPGQRAEIREALAGASVRRVGGLMMGSIPASNHVYNAAASVATAVMGGPEGLSQAIRALDPAFAPIAARRYMLAPRDRTGDNEATAAALAAVLQRLGSGKLVGVDPGALASAREAVAAKDDYLGLEGPHRTKGGALNTDPITRVESGWWDAPGVGRVVYVAMLTQPGPGSRPRAEAADRLEATARQLVGRMLRDARPAPAR